MTNFVRFMSKPDTSMSPSHDVTIKKKSYFKYITYVFVLSYIYYIVQAFENNFILI